MTLLGQVDPSPVQHSFLIEFKCPDCLSPIKGIDKIRGTIEEILGSIFDGGWPICPECGLDMEFNVKG